MIFRAIQIVKKFTITGPELPYKMSGSAMVSSPDGKGIILIGGYNRDFGIANKFLYELRPEKFTWQKLSQTLHGLLFVQFISNLNALTQYVKSAKSQKSSNTSWVSFYYIGF